MAIWPLRGADASNVDEGLFATGTVAWWPYDEPSSGGTTAVVPAIAKLAEAYRACSLPIVHVVRLYDGEDVDLPRRAAISAGKPIVRPGTSGSQIAALLMPRGESELDPELLLNRGLQQLADREWAMWKPRWGAFHRTRLHQRLTALEVNTLVIAGCNYPNCPRATSYASSEHDYRTLLVEDALSGLEDGPSGRSRAHRCHPRDDR